MSTTETKALIEQAVHNFENEVPALKPLKLIMRLELYARGEVPTWRVQLPGPVVTKDAAGDSRIDVTLARPTFNELAETGNIEDWADAYERGALKVSGDAGVLKLVGNVIQRQRQRQRARPR